MDASVVVALIGTLGVILVALINRGRDTGDVREVREELESVEILLDNEKRENGKLRDILAAKELYIHELLTQMHRHMPEIKPAEYEPPGENNGEA